MPRNRSYRSLVKAVFSTPWAIEPDKMEAIAELIAIRARGDVVSQEQIAAAVQQRTSRTPRSSVGSIAVVNVFGVISRRASMLDESSGGTSVQAIDQAITNLAADSDVAAILLNIDSPGGSASGIAELADKIFALRDTKPIWGIIDGQGNSGALWIASQVSQLWITRSSVAGSLGVAMLHTDTSKMDEKLGVKQMVIRVPDNKAAGIGGEPLSDAEVRHRKDMISQMFEMFTASVARGRNTTVAKVLNDFGGGRILTAKDALAAGMVDRIGTFDEIITELGAGLRGSAGAPAFTGGIDMDQKVFGCLVRLGMCDITASTEDAEAALGRFFAAVDVDDPKDDAKRLTVLQDHIAKRKTAKPAVGASASGDKKETAASSQAAEIMAAVRMSRIPEADQLAFAQQLISDNVSINDAIKRISERSAEVAKPTGATVIRATESQRDKLTESAIASIVGDALSIREPRQVWSPRRQEYVEHKPQRPNYRFAKLLTLAEECLIADGLDAYAVRSLAPVDIAKLALGLSSPRDFGILASSDGSAYNTTGTFPNLMIDAFNVVLRTSYDDTRTTFSLWMRQGPSVPDFKTVNKIIAGELSNPKAIPEDGEFEEATMSDAKETYKLTVWGHVFSLSWQATVNDTTGSFMEIPMKMGRSMRRKQNQLAYQHVKDNPTMADTGALFNATAITTAGGHNNQTTGALSTVADYTTAFNTMTRKMAEQKGVDTSAAGAILNLMPRYVVFPPAIRGIVRQTLGSSSTHANNAGVTNIWEQALVPVEEGELGAGQASGSDTAFYLASDARDVDTVEYAYLQGLETPRLEQVDAFDRLARKWRIYQAFAVKALDHRGLQKHTGV